MSWIGVPEAVAEIRAGRPLIVTDAHDRENEGDLVVAAEHARGHLFEMADQRATDLYQVFERRSGLLALREGANWIPEELAIDLDGEWSRLFAMGWMRRRDIWQRLPRYLAAIEKRLERMQRDHAKDRRKLEPLLPLQGALQQAWSDWHPALRQEAILLLQEWRIATFAPELRPHEKVSEKRIRLWLGERGLVV